MPLIPTFHKEKLPAGFAYPLGAEAISAELGDLPMFQDAELWFRWRDEYWASRWRKRVASQGVVTLLKIDSDYRADRWRLMAYSVPAQYAVLARKHLREELGRLRRALAATSAEPRGRHISVSFDLSAAEQAANPEISPVGRS